MRTLGGAQFLLLIVVGLLCAFSNRLVNGECTKTGACSCNDPATGTVDLSPLDGGGSAKFPDQPSANAGDTYLYSWNPCTPFTESDCAGVSGCQVAADKSIGYPIGTQDTAAFATDGTGTLSIQYSATDSTGGVRYLTVDLICDPNDNPGTLKTVGETTTSNYAMALNSIHCCPSTGPKPGPSGGGGGSDGLSIGSILTIVFFAILIIYAAAGVGLQMGVRKARGKEAIPNYTLWSAVPGLVRDGVLFTFTCGKRASYDKI